MKEVNRIVYHFLRRELYDRFIQDLSRERFVEEVKSNKKLAENLFSGCRVNAKSFSMQTVQTRIKKSFETSQKLRDLLCLAWLDGKESILSTFFGLLPFKLEFEEAGLRWMDELREIQKKEKLATERDRYQEKIAELRNAAESQCREVEREREKLELKENETQHKIEELKGKIKKYEGEIGSIRADKKALRQKKRNAKSKTQYEEAKIEEEIGRVDEAVKDVSQKIERTRAGLETKRFIKKKLNAEILSIQGETRGRCSLIIQKVIAYTGKRFGRGECPGKRDWMHLVPCIM